MSILKGQLEIETSDVLYPKTSAELVEYLSNKNLLTNGDFQVWQYGETFTINQNKKQMTASRWWVWSPQSHVIEKNADGGIKCTTKNNSTCGLYQYIENDLENGETYTLSAMINGSLKELTFVYENTSDFIKSNTYLTIGKQNNGYLRVGVLFEANKTSICKYVKLEKGKATPLISRTYGEELKECERFYVAYHYSFAMTNSLEYEVSFPTEMRTTPTYTFAQVKYGTNASNLKTSLSDSETSGVKLIRIDKRGMGFRQNYNNGIIAISFVVTLNAEIH